MLLARRERACGGDEEAVALGELRGVRVQRDWHYSISLVAWSRLYQRVTVIGVHPRFRSDLAAPGLQHIRRLVELWGKIFVKGIDHHDFLKAFVVFASQPRSFPTCRRPAVLRRFDVETCPTARLAVVRRKRPRTLHSAMPNDRGHQLCEHSRGHGSNFSSGSFANSCPGVSCTSLSSSSSSGVMFQFRESHPKTTMLRASCQCLNRGCCHSDAVCHPDEQDVDMRAHSVAAERACHTRVHAGPVLARV